MYADDVRPVQTGKARTGCERVADFPEAGITIRTGKEAAESIVMNGLELSLLASGDGMELIRHRLKAKTSWAMVPESGWTALEFLVVISGSLRWRRESGDVILRAGDSLSAQPVSKHCIFIAIDDCEFLYASSQPVFHLYSQQLHQMRNLAVTVEEKDGYTAEHCTRIMNLAMLVGRQMKLGVHELYHLNFGAFLHDLGKVRVPERILGKPGGLTDDEWVVMKQHTLYGRDMLQETKLPFLLAAGQIVQQHHERYNGTGYPYGLIGSDILLTSAIVGVVDSYDAITSDRVYRPGRPHAEALAEIRRCRGTLYHPDVVDAFVDIERAIERHGQ